ncbi:hypothetical protein AURDEDRAFT_126183 [Auricularia subglabra TFB-10046 SS5]|nr:hypothetical protein AURDEDRAFT_126183 [Auricularia subglabra TFB-10046 SS5]
MGAIELATGGDAVSAVRGIVAATGTLVDVAKSAAGGKGGDVSRARGEAFGDAIAGATTGELLQGGDAEGAMHLLGAAAAESPTAAQSVGSATTDPTENATSQAGAGVETGMQETFCMTGALAATSEATGEAAALEMPQGGNAAVDLGSAVLGTSEQVETRVEELGAATGSLDAAVDTPTSETLKGEDTDTAAESPGGAAGVESGRKNASKATTDSRAKGVQYEAAGPCQLTEERVRELVVEGLKPWEPTLKKMGTFLDGFDKFLGSFASTADPTAMSA